MNLCFKFMNWLEAKSCRSSLKIMNVTVEDHRLFG